MSRSRDPYFYLLFLASAAAVLLFLLPLASCTSPASIPVCPPLKQYSPTEMTEMAEAVAGLSPDSALLTIVLDYQAMRDADRACLSSTPSGSH